jgi:hypothetical protein
MNWRAMVLLAAVLLVGNSAVAQSPANAASGLGASASESSQFRSNEPPLATSQSADTGRGLNVKRVLSTWEFVLSALVMGFGVLLILVQAILLWRTNATPEDALRTITVTAIVIGAIFFVTAGFDSVQVAPAAGLFGTIAGYLLGKAKSEGKS